MGVDRGFGRFGTFRIAVCTKEILRDVAQGLLTQREEQVAQPLHHIKALLAGAGRCALVAAAALCLWPLGAAAEQGGGEQGETTVSVSDSQEKFIYLDDGSDPSPVDRDLPLLQLNRASSLNRVGITSNLLGKGRQPVFMIESPPYGIERAPIEIDAFALAPGAKSRMELGYPVPQGDSGNPEGFGVWLSSEVVAPVADLRIDGLQSVEPGIAGRSYNVGLNVGYGRFALGAALLRREQRLSPGYQGFDLGFGYYGDSWFTNVNFADYRNDAGPLFFSLDQDRRLQAFGVGAGYALWPWLTFSGQFKYFDYSNRLFPDISADQERVFSLDTKLNF